VAGVPEIGERKSSWDFEKALFYLGWLKITSCCLNELSSRISVDGVGRGGPCRPRVGAWL
jgi:hypothetical protein